MVSAIGWPPAAGAPSPSSPSASPATSVVPAKFVRFRTPREFTF